MSCDARSDTSDTAPSDTCAPAADAVAPAVPLRQHTGSVLRRLETLAQAELHKMQIARPSTPQNACIDDSVWASLAWDMGLNGTAIDAAGTPEPIIDFVLHDID
ncbi:hypothetical protein [Xanthomonas sp. MUS 060]|uniref:hypothetical protein n=1 Tax=Xanthomonas sp. MUS 060 TaxID=1588031 RepID=UPI0005F2C50C|nr:hypothetical protein [Xanthomonas sp. MUS 060]